MTCDRPASLESCPRKLKQLAQDSLSDHLRKVDHHVLRLAAKRGKGTEHIHELRTESRRSDAGLKLFADFLSRKRARWLHRRLARLRSIAGSVRDLDVMKGVLRDSHQKLPPEFRLWLKHELQRCRAKQVKALIRHCRQVAATGVARRIRKLVDSVAWPNRNHDAIRQKFFHDSLHRVALPLLNSIQQCEQQPEKFHQVRIDARRMRYTIDLLNQGLSWTATKPLLEPLSEIQSLLGQAHDRIAFLDFLRAQSNRSPLDEATFASLLETLQQEHEHQFSAMMATCSELAAQLPRQLRESSMQYS